MIFHNGHPNAIRFACLTGLLLLSIVSGSAQRKEIIGYFPSWKWMVKDNPLTPEKIPYDKLTIINYAFFYPRPDGTITGRDSVGDALYLGSPQGTRLTDLAHKKNVKVLLSLGGWDDSGNFPAVAASPALRETFARSCMDAVRRYGFDGIDIDWEYPGYAEHNGTPADKENYTLLMQLLKDSLTTYSSVTGTPTLLTAAFAATASHSDCIDFKKIGAILDQLNLMTYDFHGRWSPLSNHNSPLYSSAGSDSALCMDAALTLYTRVYDIPPSKLNLGLAFYGKLFAQCTGLNSTHSAADTMYPDGASYSEILKRIGDFTRSWDDRAKVPYLISPAMKLFVSYDDEESIRIKAQYMVDREIHGCIIWEITDDYLPDGTSPLLNAVSTTFESAKTSIH
jgi:chitinase